MRRYINLNTILLVVIGLALVFWGAWTIYRVRDYMFGGGILLIGVGNIIFGITNGFADVTPRGRFLFKIAMFSYVVGVISVLYTMRYMLGIY